MSIFFRLKYALGLIPSADQLDAKWENLIKMRDDLKKMEESDDLKKHEELKSIIESAAFKHNKREIEGLQYHGSEEEELILAYNALLKSAKIRNYQKVLKSTHLERFESIEEGPELKRFLHLEAEVGGEDFKSLMGAQKKKEFIKTPEYTIFSEYNHLRKSADIRFWKKFGNSLSYQNYLETIDSLDLMRLEELKGLIAVDEFKERVVYLKDKKRYNKSDDFQNIVAFDALDKSAFMAEYRKLKKAKELEFFEKWDVVLDENFPGKVLDSKKWQPENWINFKLSGLSFSQNDDLQAFNGLKNVEVQNNTLSILAKKEKVSGRAWNPAIGFTPTPFEYTSATLNNADFFRVKEGVVEAKIRFKKDGSITSAFSLTGEKPFPQIDLVRSNKDGVGMGIIENQGSGSSKYVKIGGLNDENYHIYRLELWNNEIVWKINGYEIFRCFTNLKEPVFFNLLTSLHGTVNEQLLPHRFEIKWIRCFELKQ
jgi:beta-glucanase (GH16 family)